MSSETSENTILRTVLVHRPNVTSQKRPKTDNSSSRRETALPQCLMWQVNTTFTDTYQLRHRHLYNNFFLSPFPRVQEDPREPMTRLSHREYLHVWPHFRYSQKHLAGNCSQTDFLCIVKKCSSFQLQGHLHWRTNSESKVYRVANINMNHIYRTQWTTT